MKRFAFVVFVALSSIGIVVSPVLAADDLTKFNKFIAKYAPPIDLVDFKGKTACVCMAGPNVNQPGFLYRSGTVSCAIPTFMSGELFGAFDCPVFEVLSK